MGSFIGSNGTFKRYIGPRLRNVVNTISREYRNQVGACENCNSTENLESAHIHGRERPVIIDEILEEFTNGQTITIDLEVFEERFKRAHEPIQEVIRVLCRNCHQEYDAIQRTPIQVNNEGVGVGGGAVEDADNDELQVITNREITDTLRNLVGTTLPLDEVNRLTSTEYSNQTFGVHFSVLKPIPMNANAEQIRQLAIDSNGYNRWSTRNPIERDGNRYLVMTQWYHQNRAPFITWLTQFQPN